MGVLVIDMSPAQIAQLIGVAAITLLFTILSDATFFDWHGGKAQYRKKVVS